ncbi:MAG: DUF4062 domain-containing protein [Defluviitaleaceae bacterium]|nr:DUF4062 domain-containing protein [Defluviitaleaceae bacterium]
MTNKKYQIFISSTFEDLKEEREATIKTILSLNHIPIGMEMFNAGDDEQWAVIERTIDTSDYYVVILGLKYGSMTDDGIGYTEKEYDYAISKKIPVLTFIKDESVPSTIEQREADAEKIEKLKSFRDKAKNKMAQFWKTKDELTTMLSTSLYNAFYTHPRNGWIPADFDPLAQAQELATLSKENRELRKLIEAHETRKPLLDFNLESESGLCFTFCEASDLAVRIILSQEDITRDFIDNLEAQDISAAENYINNNAGMEDVTLFEVFDKLFTEKDGVEKSITIDIAKTLESVGTIDYRKQLTEEIEKYSSKLPSQEEFDMYNAKRVRYVNMTKNKHKLCVRVKNTGNISANNIVVSFSFPSEILVYNDYDIQDIEEPASLKLPSNPLSKNRKSNITRELIVPSLEITKRQPRALYEHPSYLAKNINVNFNRDYYINGTDYLCYENEKLMHTHTVDSHDFYIVTVARGEFEIEASLICEELLEPVVKKFKVIVE